jgi:hypothetical protein
VSHIRRAVTSSIKPKILFISILHVPPSHRLTPQPVLNITHPRHEAGVGHLRLAVQHAGDGAVKLRQVLPGDHRAVACSCVCRWKRGNVCVGVRTKGVRDFRVDRTTRNGRASVGGGLQRCAPSRSRSSPAPDVRGEQLLVPHAARQLLRRQEDLAEGRRALGLQHPMPHPHSAEHRVLHS